MTNPPRTYHAFFSYSNADRNSVHEIVKWLEGQGLEIYMDADKISPGDSWSAELDKALQSAKCVVAFIGPSGLGPVQRREIEAANTIKDRESASGNAFPVIPIVLPGGNADAESVLFAGTSQKSVDPDDENTLSALFKAITGRELPSGRPRELDNNRLIVDLHRQLGSRNIVFILGRWLEPPSKDLPPVNTEITETLLGEIGLIPEGGLGLLPATSTAAAWYSVWQSTDRLEDRLVEILEERTTRPSNVHVLIARIMSLLRKPMRRSQKKLQRLIISTRFDLLMERSLLIEGLSFNRIVNRRNGDVTSTRFDVRKNGDQLELDGQLVAVTDAKAIDEWIKTKQQQAIDDETTKPQLTADPGGQQQEGEDDLHSDVLLYKPHGSLDVPESCFLATEQYLDLATAHADARVEAILAQSPWLLVGFRPLDSDLRALCQSLLRKVELYDPKAVRYAPILRPERIEGGDENPAFRAERKLWDDVETTLQGGERIKLIDQDPSVFLGKLLNRIVEDPPR